MLDTILALAFLIGIAGIVVALIVAVQRGQALGRLNARLEKLEREVARMRRLQEAARIAEEAPEGVAAEESTPELEVLEALPAEPSPPRPPPARHVQGPDADTLEAWIGRQGFGWAAVVLLLFATAFFLKYAFENRW